ncbi:MAG TPA: helix-turn-helix transcriptional regulator [Verrucomicrobiae bacterium]|nr:helix-turn-helix transcriptional regulator [Verrucomicrobiae bacterium]HVX83979.1 helix-turn-helix transcriptional regulator [Phycisphaerae bacterium]
MGAIQHTLGFHIRRLRLQKRWTQEELAARCSKHWTYIGGIERGERNPSIQVIAEIAKALGVPPASLLKPLPRSGK